ncbi:MULTISPECIES: WhiB family transcriptional regulator [Nonomuraea]|uniref:WhiB family transcriptional regulator n=1 Tax=Nonomuraea TaxID=83681 RepID=UPI0012FA943C|nr:WhiB family transcriptional regulator [Nonomuraea typhae]
MVLKPRTRAPDWSASGNPTRAAKCLPFRPNPRRDPWFDPAQYSDALAVCNGEADGLVCPMRQQCLEFACINNESIGIWGGLPPHDRRALRWERKAHLKNPKTRTTPWEWTWHPPTQQESADLEAEESPLLA